MRDLFRPDSLHFFQSTGVFQDLALKQNFFLAFMGQSCVKFVLGFQNFWL